MNNLSAVRTRSNRSLRIIALTAGCTVAGLSLSARAVDIDWDNTSGDGNWNTPANWSTDMVPANGAPPDADATFVNPAAGPATISTDVPAVRDIRFGSDARTGSGVLNQTGGTIQLAGWMRMGINAGSGGTFNMSGGTMNIGGRYYVAADANSTSTVTQTGGTINFATNADATTQNQGAWFGDQAGATANYTISGNSVLRQGQVLDLEVQDGWNRIGGNGTANMTINGGTVSFDGRTLIGAGATGVGNITQTAGTFETRRSELDIADTGRATYTISGGTLRKGGTQGDGLVVGQWTGSNGTLNVSGTANVVTDTRLIVGHGDPGAAADTATGVVNQTGGTVTVTDELVLGRNVSGNGTYNLSGGVLDMTGNPIEIGLGNGAFNMTGGEVRNASSIEGDDDNGPFSHGGGVISAGPGTGIGTTAINGNYTQVANPASPPTVRVDITATGSDVLDVNGAAVLNGVLDLVITPGTTLVNGQTFTVLTADALTGTFADAPPVGSFIEDGYAFTTSYANNSVTLTVVPIPEPATAGLAVLGAAGLFLRRRRSLR